MKNKLFLFSAFILILSGCIKDDIIDDYVEPTLRISTFPNSIITNSTYQFEYKYFNNIGVEENVDAVWSSRNPNIIEIDNSGFAVSKEIGSTEIVVEYSNSEVDLSQSITVNVGLSTVEGSTDKSGFIETTSSYALEGDFTINLEDNELIISFEDNYRASTALPGLYVYLSNNRNTITNAYEIGAVETFNGQHSYSLEGIGINDFEYLLYFCKPFNVKVGDGKIE